MSLVCSKSKCSIQYDVNGNNDFSCTLTSDECPYYTPKLDYEVIYENICNHIADLVVEKLKNREARD